MARRVATIASRVIVTAVALGLLAAGMLVHRFRRDAADGSRPPVEVAASPAATALTRPARAGGGWIARPEPGRHSDAGASGHRPPVAEAFDAEVQGNRASAAASATPLRSANPRRNAGQTSHSVPLGQTAAGIPAEWAVPLRNVDAVFGSRRTRDSDADSDAARGAQAESGQPEEAAPPLDEASPIYDSGETARFSTDTRVQVPDSGVLSGETGTISFQFEPEWSGDNQADAALVEIGESHLMIRKHNLILRFEMKDDDGNGLVAPVSMAQWEPGRPYLVTATWSGGVMMLYVDGRVVAHQPFGPRVEIPAGAAVYVGTVPQDAPVAPGSLSNIQLFKEALSPLQVATRAAQVPRQTD